MTHSQFCQTAGSERRGTWGNLRFGGRLQARRAGEREALLLTMICALDMYTTLWWVVQGRAVEANPHLSWTFQHHPLLFILVKSGTCLPALLLATKLAERHPQFTTWLLRAVIVTYIGYYLLNIH